MAEPIRVLIADDHAVVRVGLRALIASEPSMEMVGEAGDGVSAAAMARSLQPDVLLLDLVMPGKHGIQVIEELAETAPRVRILVLTSFVEDEQLFSALRAGALGYLLKEAGPDELLQGIRDVAGGKSPLHPAVARRVLQGLSRTASSPPAEALTDREAEILGRVARGRSNRAIASELGLSERTVRSHVSSILAKLSVTSRTQAALFALRTGLARLDDE
jgi:two-component system, NarL family, response regulator LiaR